MAKLSPSGRIAAALIAMCLLAACSISCNKSTEPTVQQSAPLTPASAAKRYHLKGKVVSIDEQSKMANIDSEAIPNFMDAMTMAYTVKPEDELDELKPGDAITADVVVKDENAWLENITVTGHSAAPASK